MPDAADGLPGAFFVFDQSEAHVVVAIISKADARAYGYLGVGEQELGKLERLQLAVGLGDLRPDEHRGLGTGYLPAGAVEALDQHVAAAAVVLRDFAHAFLRTLQGRNR